MTRAPLTPPNELNAKALEAARDAYETVGDTASLLALRSAITTYLAAISTGAPEPVPGDAMKVTDEMVKAFKREYYADKGDGSEGRSHNQAIRDSLQAAIATCGSSDLAAVIEECAKIAENYSGGFHNDARDPEELMQISAKEDAAAEIATAIRALAQVTP